ncbi:MAG: PAS domain S-box protein [Anaerolineales bacterium]
MAKLFLSCRDHFKHKQPGQVAAMLTLLVLILLCFLWIWIGLNRRMSLLESERQYFELLANQYNSALSAALQRRLSMLESASAYVEERMVLTTWLSPVELEVLSDALYRNEDVFGIGIFSKDGKLSYLYPKVINELPGCPSSILDTFSEPAEDTKQHPRISSPFSLPDNEVGLCIYQSIYQRGNYQGAVAMVLRFSSLWNEAGLNNLPDQYTAALRDKHGAIVWGDTGVLRLRSLAIPLDVENVGWQLIVAKDEGQTSADETMQLYWVGGLLLCLLFSGLFYLGAVWVIKSRWQLSRQAETISHLQSQYEAKLQAVLDSVSDAVYIELASSHRILDANAAASRMTGYTREELRSMSTDDLNLSLSARPVIERESAFVIEQTHRNGSRLLVEMRSVPVNLPGEELIVRVVSDISERERTQRALQRSEDSLKQRTERIIRNQAALIQLAQIDYTDWDQTSRAILRTAAGILEVERVSLWLFEQGNKKLYCELLYHLSSDSFESGIELNAEEAPFFFETLERNAMLSVNLAQEDERTCQLTEIYLKPHNITSLLVVPVRRYGRIVAMILHEHVGDAPRNWMIEDEDFAASIADVTSLSLEAVERKHAEEKLAESEERYRSLVETSPDAIFLTDPKGVILFCNVKMAEIFGYQQTNELIGAGITDLVIPSDQHRLRQDMEDALKSGIVHQFEYNFRRSDNTTFPGEISFSFVVGRSKQGALGFTGILRDVSERKRSQAQLNLQSAALESAANAIIITDRDGNILWVNPAFTVLSGYSIEEIIGKNTRILNSKRQNRDFYRSMWQNILSGQVWHGELFNRRKDGSVYPEEMTITPVRAFGGEEITHFIAIKQDITLRRQREREQSVLISIASALRAASTRSEMITTLLTKLLELLDAQGAAFITRLPETGDGLCELGIGVWSDWMGERIPADKGITGLVFQTAQFYFTNDVENDPLLFYKNRMGGLERAACVPLIVQGQIIGAVWVGRHAEFTEDVLHTILGIVDISANAIQRAALYEEARRRIQRLAALHNIDMAITASVGLHNILNTLLEQVMLQLDADASAVLLLDQADGSLQYFARRGFRSLKQGEAREGCRAAQQVAKDRQMLAIRDISLVDEELFKRLPVDEERFIAYHAVPLLAKGQTQGVLEVFHRRAFEPDSEWLDFLEMLAGQAAIAVDNAILFDRQQQTHLELTQSYDATLEGWARALELRDLETLEHTRRVTDMVQALARAMGVPEEQLIHIRRGALLHDIGKLAIPDSVLLKASELDEEEWEIMKLHPVYAYQLLHPIPYLRPALEIPYCHHERWDGTGYPRGLSGEEIPLSARIFAVVDVWDALLSDRPYRKAWTPKQVRAYIHKRAGQQFDPQVVAMFFKLWKPE